MAKTGAERIAAERRRQAAKLGWTAEHDDAHDDGGLAMAAVCYAAAAVDARPYIEQRFAASVDFVDPWPWDHRFDARPYDGNVLIECTTDAERIRLLEKAGALIAAEIDRLLRASASPESAGGKETKR